MLRLRKKLKPESWLREGLGIWDDDEESTIFGPGRWRLCGTDEALGGYNAVGVAVSVDRSWASLAAAKTLDDADSGEDDEADEADTGRVFVAPLDRRDGVGWLVADLKRRQDENPDLVLIADEKGPAAEMRDDFEDGDVAIEWVTLDEYAQACSRFYDKVREARLRHPSSAELDEAVSGAAWRTVGDRQVWGRRKSSTDVSMLEAATLAAHGAEKYGTGFNIF